MSFSNQNLRSLARLILLWEPLVLLAAGFFYWYPSNFPAASAATGIDGAEWRWFFGLMLVGIAIITLFALWQTENETPPLTRNALTLGIILLSGAILMVIWPSSEQPIAVDRVDWLWLMAGLVPVILARAFLWRRLWTPTWYDGLMIALIILCVLSAYAAPYPSRGLKMLLRPLYGMAVMIAITEWVRRSDSLRGPLIVVTGLGLLLGGIGLGATQWTVKSEDFSNILDILPDWEPFIVAGGINPNEIGGAMTFLIPITALIIVYRLPLLWRVLGGVAFLMMAVAMFLGQSRLSIIGVIVAFAGITLFSLPGRWRNILLGVIAVIAVVQAVILFNVIPTNDSEDTQQIGLSQRDQTTSSQRLDIWESVSGIVQAHPLTGVGMNRFRYGPVARDFPIVGWDIPDPDNPSSFRQRRPPHAHNNTFQIATDLGVPGALVYIGFHLAAAYMTYISWRNTSGVERMMTLALFGGLVAHGVYGLGDAIPIWDRLAFLFWLNLGLIAGQYIRINYPAASSGVSARITMKTKSL